MLYINKKHIVSCSLIEPRPSKIVFLKEYYSFGGTYKDVYVSPDDGKIIDSDWASNSTFEKDGELYDKHFIIIHVVGREPFYIYCEDNEEATEAFNLILNNEDIVLDLKFTNK